MRFNSKKYYDGEQRTVKRFAIYPTRIDDNTIIWFEWYWSEEKFVEDWKGNEWRVERMRLIDNNSDIK